MFEHYYSPGVSRALLRHHACAGLAEPTPPVRAGLPPGARPQAEHEPRHLAPAAAPQARHAAPSRTGRVQTLPGPLDARRLPAYPDGAQAAQAASAAPLSARRFYRAQRCFLPAAVSCRAIRRRLLVRASGERHGSARSSSLRWAGRRCACGRTTAGRRTSDAHGLHQRRLRTHLRVRKQPTPAPAPVPRRGGLDRSQVSAASRPAASCEAAGVSHPAPQSAAPRGSSVRGYPAQQTVSTPVRTARHSPQLVAPAPACRLLARRRAAATASDMHLLLRTRHA